MNSRIFASALVIVVYLNGTIATATDTKQDARLTNSTKVLSELQASPDQNVPQWLLERAYAVAIVPSVLKVGLGVGARHGSGVLVVRKDDGHWTNPIFINLTGGSFGFQIGVQSSDVLLVFTSRGSIEGIVGGKITLGADASVAAGPVGRETAAATDIGLAQVYSYSRAQGLFAGVALDGSALTIDNKSNGTYYNHPGVLASEIIAGNAPQPPETAREFMAKLDTILGVGAVAASNSPSSANAVPSTVSSTTGSPTPATSALEPIPGKLTTHPMEDPNPGKEPPQ